MTKAFTYENTINPIGEALIMASKKNEVRLGMTVETLKRRQLSLAHPYVENFDSTARMQYNRDINEALSLSKARPVAKEKKSIGRRFREYFDSFFDVFDD